MFVKNKLNNYPQMLFGFYTRHRIQVCFSALSVPVYPDSFAGFISTCRRRLITTNLLTGVSVRSPKPYLVRFVIKHLEL